MKTDILKTLVLNDFKESYLGSHLGVFWAFFHPLAMLLILWFVFELGFRSGGVDDLPFVVWLSAGLVPWFFFASSVANGTNSVLSNSYLVKKVVFNLEYLPLIKVISSLLVHVVFIVFLFLLCFFYEIYPSIYWIQIPIYSTYLLLLTYAIVLFTSAISVFVKDTVQFISIIVQFGFWLTPIFWSLSMIPEEYRSYFGYSPVYFVVEGYRKSIAGEEWIWENPLLIFNLILLIVLVVIGKFTFKKLKLHFADVI